MKPTTLFVRTYDDLHGRIHGDSTDEYLLLRSAALLRQMLLDRSPLVDVVNRGFQKKILYEVNDPATAPASVAPAGSVEIASVGPLAFDPSRAPGRLTIKLRRQEFLRLEVMRFQGIDFTIHDVIDCAAHHIGAVHFGAPKEDHLAALYAFGDFLRIGCAANPAGANCVIATLEGIGGVVLTALAPLYEAILAPPSVELFEASVAIDRQVARDVSTG